MRALWTIFLFVLLPIRVWAQSINYTVDVDAPLSGVVRSGCEEDVALAGSIRGHIHYVQVGEQITLDTHVGPRDGAKAVGMDSGIQYNVNGNTVNRMVLTAGAVDSISYQNLLNIVGLAKVHYTYKVVFAPDGLHVIVENIRGDCR